MNKVALKALISEGLACDYLEVNGDDGRHFDAIVVSAAFESLSMLKQHKLVYATLGGRMENDEIHALSLKTYTPAQWQVLLTQVTQ